MMMGELYSWFRPVLFRLDPEDAHDLTLLGLEWAVHCGLGKLVEPHVNARPVRAMGLEFPNVVGLAAGLDKDGTCVDGFGALGFGHIEVGTITPRPQPGNTRPRLFRLIDEEAVVNRMGFNNPGLDGALRNIAHRRWRGILGFNIGKNFDTPNSRAVDDYVACLRGAHGTVDYVTANISSPNTEGLRELQQEDAIRHLVRTLKAEQDVLAQQHGKLTPIAIKIAPDLDDESIKTLARLFLEERVDGVVATNTTVSRKGVEYHLRAREAGGMSGKPLRERATEVIRLLASEMGGAIPIIGVGGIMSGADAREKIEAGAVLVQIYTGLIFRGPALIEEILKAV
jgi:dihydroorotate dehydrogenase